MDNLLATIHQNEKKEPFIETKRKKEKGGKKRQYMVILIAIYV